MDNDQCPLCGAANCERCGGCTGGRPPYDGACDCVDRLIEQTPLIPIAATA